jgi:hypothetical protein
MAAGSTQPFARREAIDSGDAWPSAVPAVHANRVLIIVIGDNDYTTPSLSEEIGERAKVVGVFAGHAGYTRLKALAGLYPSLTDAQPKIANG